MKLLFYFSMLLLYSANESFSQNFLAEGTRLKSESTGKTYLILDREKHEIPSTKIYDAIFKDWNGIIEKPEMDVDLLPNGKPLKGAFLCKGSGAAVFLVYNGRKRHVTDPAVFDALNFDWNKIKTLSDQAILKYPTDKPIEYLSPEAGNIYEPKPCGVK